MEQGGAGLVWPVAINRGTATPAVLQRALVHNSRSIQKVPRVCSPGSASGERNRPLKAQAARWGMWEARSVG